MRYRLHVSVHAGYKNLTKQITIVHSLVSEMHFISFFEAIVVIGESTDDAQARPILEQTTMLHGLVTEMHFDPSSKPLWS